MSLNQPYFDALIEGRLHAATKGKDEVVLYRLYDDASDQIAVFASEQAFCGLIGGYQDIAAFNDAMDKRRAEFAALVTA